MGGDHRQNSTLDKRRCFQLRGGAFMRSVLDRGGPSGPYVVVLSERWWCFYTIILCFRPRGWTCGAFDGEAVLFL